MAIHVVNPNTVGQQTEAMFDITSSTVKVGGLISDFAISINNLNSHWKGSDAVANLADLSKVYNAVADLVKSLQTLIVMVNNEEILPLQKHINSSGGQCTVGKELGVSLTVPSINVATEATESWADGAIITDAEEFNGFPTKFSNFVNTLNEAKNTLLGNWLEGGNRTAVVRKFEEFNNNVADYNSQITRVRDNINTVAENKSKFGV